MIIRLPSEAFAARQDLIYVDVFKLFPMYEKLAFHGGLILEGPKGIGKAQPLHSRVLTPNGFVSMGDLTVGMEVISHEGVATKVTGVFPQGEKSVYRVSMSDGSEAECCEEHLWETHTLSDVYSGKPPQVRSLQEIRSSLIYQESLSAKMTRPTRNHRIPGTAPVEFEAPSKPCLLHPYLMGVLLGDGSFIGGSIQVSNSEKDIQQRCEKLLPTEDGMHVSKSSQVWTIHRRATKAPSEVRKILTHYGLHGKKSVGKFIPSAYLFASVEERRQLLAGLLDTDGSVIASGQRVEFGTSSPQLHEDMLFLARSLGAIVRHSSRIPIYTYKGERLEGSRAWRHSIYFPDRSCPVTAKKHVSKWTNKHTQYYRTIDSIEPIGKMECQCISVATDRGLYVTDDFIVTHNSLSFAAYAAKINCPIITFDCSEDARRSHLHGSFTLKGDQTPFVLGPVTTAFEVANEMGHCILVFEEINALAPQSQKLLNALTDFRCRVEVPAAERVFKLDEGAQLWVVGTMNSQVYGGVYALNEDLKSRFDIMHLSYPGNKLEMDIVKAALPTANASYINSVLRLATQTRAGQTQYALSTREVVKIIRNIQLAGESIALRLIPGKFEDNDRETVKKWIQSIFSVKP